ncbi:EcsC family protein [Polymorphospora sp. NPDC051019]
MPLWGPPPATPPAYPAAGGPAPAPRAAGYATVPVAAPPAGAPDDPAADDGTAAPPASLWEKMRADPQYAPEHLALEAVRRLGPEARRWVERVHLQQPGLHPDVVAQKAAKKFINLARLSGAVSGATGLPGAVVDVGVLAWTQARMVLHIAAAYGVDPAHPDRATDLLVLQKVHKVAETARMALGVAAGREKAGALFRSGTKTPVGQVALKLGMKLAQMAGVKAAKKLFAKMIPGAAIILGTWANSSATTDLARRAQALYRQPAIGQLPHQRHP